MVSEILILMWDNTFRRVSAMFRLSTSKSKLVLQQVENRWATSEYHCVAHEGRPSRVQLIPTLISHQENQACPMRSSMEERDVVCFDMTPPLSIKSHANTVKINGIT